MYEEQLGDWTYTRLESEDWEELKGKRVKGYGKIVGWTTSEGEQHPAILHTTGDEDLTPEDLPYAEFDGRHGFIDL